jgi:hypothetical protein
VEGNDLLDLQLARHFHIKPVTTERHDCTLQTAGRAANSSSLDWTSRRSSSDHRWPARMKAHLRPVTVPLKVSLTSTFWPEKGGRWNRLQQLQCCIERGHQFALIPILRWLGPSTSCSYARNAQATVVADAQGVGSLPSLAIRQ